MLANGNHASSYHASGYNANGNHANGVVVIMLTVIMLAKGYYTNFAQQFFQVHQQAFVNEGIFYLNCHNLLPIKYVLY